MQLFGQHINSDRDKCRETMIFLHTLSYNFKPLQTHIPGRLYIRKIFKLLDRTSRTIQESLPGKSICLKATFHSTIFDIPMRPMCEDQIHRRRFTRQRWSATPVMVIIPLNFARCTLPTHINR